MKGKKREILLLTGKKAKKNAYPTKIRTPVIKSKATFHVLKENPIRQRTIPKSLKYLCRNCE